MRVEKIMATAQEILKELVVVFPKEMKGRDGGWLVIKKYREWGFVHSKQIRMNVIDVPKERFSSFRVNAKEKADRLRGMAIRDGHVSSWQSRDFDNKQYGGAIMAGNWVLSFSGLPEHMDEYFMIKLAVRLELIAPARVNEIIKISENPFEV